MGKFFRDFLIFLNRIAKNIDDNRSIQTTKIGDFFGDKTIHPDILQTNGIEHAAGGLNDTGRWISVPWVKGYSFHNHATQSMQVDQVSKLSCVAKGPRCGHYRIVKLQGTYLDAKIREGLLFFYELHTNSSALKTGPSEQTWTYFPSLEGILQPKHAPIPQAITLSTET